MHTIPAEDLCYEAALLPWSIFNSHLAPLDCRDVVTISGWISARTRSKNGEQGLTRQLDSSRPKMSQNDLP